MGSPLTAQGPPCPIKSSSVMTGFSVRGSRLNGFYVRVRGSVTTGIMSGVHFLTDEVFYQGKIL